MMSLFQCENCGCAENTALSCQGIGKVAAKYFDWSGIEELKGKMLCSSCAPSKLSDGDSSGLGKWHNEFKQAFLPMGKFKTNKQGNLQHIDNGDIDYRKYAIDKSEV